MDFLRGKNPRKVKTSGNLKDKFHKSSRRNVSIFFSKQFEVCHFAIAKNASSLLRPWIYSLDDLSYEEENALYGPRTIQLSIKEYRLRFPNYFLFTCVRNPFSRLISCYLDKFVFSVFKDGKRIQYSGDDIQAFQSNLRIFRNVENYAQRELGSTPDGGLTFEQFLNSIQPDWPPAKVDDDCRCDSHWASQFDLMAFKELGYDAVLKCESLSSEMEVLQGCLGIPKSKFVQGRRNETRGKHSSNTTAGYLGNVPAAELSSSGAARTAADLNFFTPETVDLVFDLYGKDVAVFGYEPPQLN